MRKDRGYYAGLYGSVLLKLTISETETVVKASIAQKKGATSRKQFGRQAGGKGPGA